MASGKKNTRRNKQLQNRKKLLEASAKDDEKIGKLLEEKKELCDSLNKIENQIYQLEGAYLERTWYEGNVIKGWNEKHNVLDSLCEQKKRKNRPVNFEDPKIQDQLNAMRLFSQGFSRSKRLKTSTKAKSKPSLK